MNAEIESERINKISDLEADIRAIKEANPNWASDAGDKAAIMAKDNRILALEQRGKSSLNLITHPVSHDNHLVSILPFSFVCVFFLRSIRRCNFTR